MNARPEPTPTDDVALDPIGQIVVPPEQARIARDKLAADLRRDWPGATPEQVQQALTRVLPVYLRTLETGRINYVAASSAGREAAKVLSG